MSELNFRLNVTNKDIEDSVPVDVHKCPISLSLKRRGFSRPNVDCEYIRFTDKRTGKRYKMKTPERISIWIDEFDWPGTEVRPISFVVKI